jgi:acyl carrier protein
VAYLVPGQNSALTPGEVREYLKQKLPGYMIPSAFLMLKSLPVTANGKVDRKALPAPTEFQHHVDESFQAPSTLVEKELARIWCEVLNLKQAGVHDNFFDSGGHSLLAIQFLFRIKDAFQVSLPVRALFEAPTISQMAERITEESQAPTTTVVTLWASHADTTCRLKRPLTLCQEELREGVLLCPARPTPSLNQPLTD